MLIVARGQGRAVQRQADAVERQLQVLPAEAGNGLAEHNAERTDRRVCGPRVGRVTVGAVVSTFNWLTVEAKATVPDVLTPVATTS